MVLRDQEGGGHSEEGSPQEAGHTRPHPVPGGEASCLSPLCRQLCQQSSNVYTAWLASVLAGVLALAGWDTRPCWGSEISSDEAFSWVPTHLPISGWMQPGPGQHTAGKTWGDWPRPLVPWPQHVIPLQQEPGGWHGGTWPWPSPGTYAFLGSGFEVTPLSLVS